MDFVTLRRLPVLFGLLLSLSPAAAAPAGPVCPNAPAVAHIAVPHLASAINHRGEAVIVALGSSSTQGAMASDPGHSYPAVLQRALSSALPDAHVAVINRGIGGQDAAEELTRLDADVLAIRPQLVIWQVGANGTLRHTDPVAFRGMVTTGVRKLQAVGIDVILMDNQRSPALLAQAAEPAFDEALAEVAADTGAGLFSRRALMRAWYREGEPVAEFIAADGLHHNDHGYFCIASALAQAILAGLSPGRPLTASR